MWAWVAPFAGNLPAGVVWKWGNHLKFFSADLSFVEVYGAEGIRRRPGSVGNW